VLILALMAVQAAGLTIHALDRVELQRAAASREAAVRSFSLWRGLVLAAPERRASLLADAELPASVSATLDDAPAARPGMPPVPERLARLFRLDAPPPGATQGAPQGPWGRRFRPAEILAAGVPPAGLLLSMRFPEGGWLNLNVQVPRPRAWHSDNF
jgi:hypothetical protein